MTLLSLAMVAVSSVGYAQDASQPPSGKGSFTEQSQLTDGLLDLLETDARTDTGESGKSSRPIVPRIHAETSSDSDDSAPAAPRSSRPAGTNNPLSEVRQLMEAASASLRQNAPLQETHGVQQLIVDRLGSLIDELAKAQKSSHESSRQNHDERLAPASERQTEQSRRESDQQPGGERPSDQPPQAVPAPPKNLLGAVQPGDTATNRVDSNVRRNDPMKLQQDVWGHLPERIRTRMQSRMVEQFLPDYRQQLEAYYRALLGQEKAE